MAMSYSYELQAKVYDKMEELEKPKTHLEVLLEVTQTLIAHEKEITQLKNDVKRIELKQDAIENSVEYYTIVAYCNLIEVRINRAEAAEAGKQCTKLSKDKGVSIGQVKEERYGYVNSYHISILDEVFGK